MKIIIKGTNINISEPIEDYLYKKMSSVEKFINDTTKVEVELKKTTNHHKTGDIFMAEVNVWSKGKLNRVERTSEDIYSAIDLMQNELFDLLSTEKDKSHTLFKRGAQKIKNMFRRG
ncbi:MAG: ribosome-associated translation inhibitor RaiA [bacterium]